MATAIDLSGTVALVTGASRGLGRAIALALAEAGADLALAARSVEDLERAAADAAKHGVRAEVFRADLRQAAGERDVARLDASVSDAALREELGVHRKFTPLEVGLRAHINVARARAGLGPIAWSRP